jgi:hypothetical protein
MKVKLSSVYGSHEKYDIEITKITLDTDNLDEREALENGWLINDGKWYLSRSTRINISFMRSKLPKIDGMEFKVEQFDRVLFDEIYAQYLARKNFSKKYDYTKDFSRSTWLVARDGGTPVAFTKMVRYDGGIESSFTAWNYHKPKMSLGNNIIYYEVEQARIADLKYLYIGSGYGESNKYKSLIDGFEWWNGSEWSTDRKLYLELCERDSKVNSLHDLAMIMNA